MTSQSPKRKTLSLKDKVEILLRQAACFRCGKPLSLDSHDWDHVVALVLGGADHPDNLCCIHTACHKIKTAQDVGRLARNRRREKRKQRRAEKRALGIGIRNGSRKLQGRSWPTAYGGDASRPGGRLPSEEADETGAE